MSAQKHFDQIILLALYKAVTEAWFHIEQALLTKAFRALSPFWIKLLSILGFVLYGTTNTHHPPQKYNHIYCHAFQNKNCYSIFLLSDKSLGLSPVDLCLSKHL